MLTGEINTFFRICFQKLTISITYFQVYVSSNRKAWNYIMSWFHNRNSIWGKVMQFSSLCNESSGCIRALSQARADEFPWRVGNRYAVQSPFRALRRSSISSFSSLFLSLSLRSIRRSYFRAWKHWFHPLFILHFHVQFLHEKTRWAKSSECFLNFNFNCILKI